MSEKFSFEFWEKCVLNKYILSNYMVKILRTTDERWRCYVKDQWKCHLY